MKKIKLVTIAVLMLVIVISSAGCRIAKEDGSLSSKDDLIGVFITGENLYEQYESKGKELEEEEGKIYGKAILEKDDEGNQLLEDYKFPGIKGTSFVREKTDNDASISGSKVFDIEIHVEMNDNYNLDKCIGTVFFNPEQVKSMTLYRIMKDEKGKIYLMTEATSGTMGFGIEKEGEAGTLEILGRKEEGIKKKKGVEEVAFVVNAQIKLPIERISILSMNKENMKLNQKNYTNDKVPGTIEIPSGTEYIIKETVSKTDKGEKTSREIIKKGEEEFQNLILDKDGFYKCEDIKLNWK